MRSLAKLQVVVVLVAFGYTLLPVSAGAPPTETEFGYQGQLKQNGAPLSALCDFEFRLFDVDTIGAPIAPVSNALLVDVENGLFGVHIDFGGSVFTGDPRWLEVAVRCPAGSGDFTPLAPRERIMAAPYSVKTRGLFVDDQEQVGIETAQPADVLHLVHDQTSDAFGGILVENVNPPAGQSAVYLDLKNNAPEAGNTYRLQHVGNVPGREGNFEIWDVGGNASRIAITKTGNVGIGTATPKRKLSIHDTEDGTLSFALKIANVSAQESTATGALFQVDGGGDRGKGAIAYRKTTTWNRGDFHFLQNSSADSDIVSMADSVMKITNAGDVGIGIAPTVAPDARLEIADYGLQTLTYPLKISNHSRGVGTAAGMLFHAGWDTESTGKGAIVYERRQTNARGAFHFLQNSDPDLSVKPSLADAVMTIANNGNVGIGIGTDAPAAKLDVRIGSAPADVPDENDTVAAIYASANVSGAETSVGVLGYTNTDFGAGVIGAAGSPKAYGVYSFGDSAATGFKFFVQPHPVDPGKEIHFVSLEGNESGTYCRGSARLENGTAVIKIPDEFRFVTEPDGLTVQVTALGPGADLWVALKTLDRVVVRGNGDAEFDYFVNGVRRGFGEFDPICKNRAFVPHVRTKPFVTQLPEAVRRILVENGTLNADFTPNEQMAGEMGWTLRDPTSEEISRYQDVQPAEGAQK